MPAPPISGVYELRNIITGNAYVGSGKDVLNRKASHFWQLRNGRHTNHLIQSDFDQYGADAFEFRLIQMAPEQHRKAIEQSFIDSGDFAYNIAKKATGGGPPKSAATIAKMRKSHTGKKHTPETIDKLRNRPAETNGGFIGYYITPAGRYPSAYQAEEAKRGMLNFATIRRWCRTPDKVISRQSYRKCAYLKKLGEHVIGQTYGDLGFGFEPSKC